MIPSGLPFASESASLISPVNVQIRAGNADDSHTHADALPVRVTRWSRPRLAALESRLTDRERAILSSVAEFRLASSAQLQRLHVTDGTPGSNQRRCRDLLRGLTELRVLARLERRVGGVRAGASAAVYGLDVAGLRLTGSQARPQRPAAPGAAFFAHTLAVTELAVQLVERGRVTSGFGLIELSAEPGCWRSFPGPLGTCETLKPDLFIRLRLASMELGSFVEVDRSTESTAAISRKLDRYRSHLRSGREEHTLGYHPRVIWTVLDQRRYEQLATLLARRSVEEQAIHQVVREHEAIEAIVRGTP